ncbi:MAG: hemagglutinin repeat-containing protein, partial [Neisseriaceae bacterium]|nr:hemagglutinin repeat-containing protein [Neisseriaceae bacterium]
MSGNLNTDLTAAKHVNIHAAQNTMSERSCNESVGGEVGVAIDVSGGGSVGVTVGANYGKGKAGGDEVAYRNSHVGSGTGQTTITAGEKLSINGGQVSGKGV